jgi:hypothetical protein
MTCREGEAPAEPLNDAAWQVPRPPGRVSYLTTGRYS